MNVPEATALIGRFKLEVDLVILNPSVPGAADFTQTLGRRPGHLLVATLDPEACEEERWSRSAWPLVSRAQ